MKCSLTVYAFVVGFAVACVSLSAGQVWADPIGIGDLGTAAPAGQQIQEVTDAVTRFRNGDFDGAYALLKSAAKKHPELPPAEVIMAQLYAAANQGDQALIWLETAAKESPTDPEAYVILGDFALRGRRLIEAGMLYNQANSLLATFKGSSKRKSLLVQRDSAGLATLAEAAQDWPGAERHLKAWLAEAPDNANALQRLGRAQFQQNREPDALAAFRQAKKADDKVLQPEAIMAGLYEAAGRREDAAKSMRDALLKAPRVFAVRLAAAQWAFDTEQYSQAKEQADAALQIDPESLQAKVLAGVVALFVRDYKAAERHFESAHIQSPSNFAALNNWALALAEQDVEAKKRKALEAADVSARAHENAAEAWSTLGWVLYRLGKLDDAEKALSKAASSGNLSADTAYYIARVFVDQKKNAEQAKKLLEGALKSKRPFSKRQEAQALLDRLK